MNVALVLVGLVMLVTFAVVFVYQTSDVRTRRRASSGRFRPAEAIEAIARATRMAPVVAPFSGRQALAYRVDVLVRDTSLGNVVTTSRAYSESQGAAALQGESGYLGSVELGPGSELFAEPELTEYPIPFATVSVVSLAMGAVPPAPHLVSFLHSRGLANLLSAPFFSGGRELIFNERIVVESAPVFVMGQRAPDGYGGVAFGGQIAWGYGSVKAAQHADTAHTGPALRNAFASALTAGTVCFALLRVAFD